MAKLQSVQNAAGKETLYVDVDDEITAIIDKVGAAKGRVVALVLPKHCPVLQSVVNMKLLKRSADRADKHLVLVTTEAGLLPLAGAIGLYVAATPSSKPAVPEVPEKAGDEPEEIDEPLSIVDGNTSGPEDFDPKAAGGKSIGELAAASAAAKDTEDDIDESIDMSDDDAVSAVSAARPTKKAKEPKPKKDKKLAVPNFDSLRKRLALGALVLVLLVAAWIFAFRVLPKATVTIGTDSSTIPTNLTLSLDTSVTKLGATNDTVPATSQSQQKTSTQTVPATGQQNNGQKAQGSVTMSAGPCSGTAPNDIPAGTTLSSGGNTYVLNSSVSFVPALHGKSCSFVGQDANNSSSIGITALKGGANGNVSSASFAVTGNSGVSASGSTSGGTDNITTIVQQSDIDNATGKISSADTSGVKQQLETNLESKGLQPVPATFLAGTPQISANEQAGAAASNVTVTAVTSYSMLGVKKSDLQTLVDSNVNGQLDKGKQVILDDGVANAQFSEENPGTANTATVAMSVKSQAGPRLDMASLKTQLAGMKSGDVQSFVKATPGVTDVNVKFSPFWVNTIPKNTAKVTINIVKGGS